MHGAIANSEVWKYQIDFFKEHYNVLVVDFKNFHFQNLPSSDQKDSLDFAHLATCIYDILKKETVECTNFITMSLGSMIVREFIELYPSKCCKVIMSAPVFRYNMPFMMLISVNKFLIRFISYKWLYRIGIFLLGPMPSNKPWRETTSKNNIDKLSYKLWAQLANNNLSAMYMYSLKKLHLPVMFVIGKNDIWFSGTTKKIAKKNKRNTVLEVIENGGHGVHVEQHEKFNRLAHKYLNEKKPAIDSPV